ncbi:MAG: GIY-YIG nuclease family protein [Clostridia bacterium]|nr:GIY-YIG nuclease family protein [Clostridia bacterium]
MSTNEYIDYFGVKIKKTDRNLLTRDNYCVPTNELDYKDKKNLKIADEFYKKNKRYPLLCPPWFCNIPNDIYKDFEHYTDEYVKEHYQNCMENFDLNMNFFRNIDKVDFNKYLMKFVKKYKFHEVTDLNMLKETKGIYIMVLDEYKQAYIGVAAYNSNIKKRIMTHWSSKKHFARLLNGSVEKSILSIDSFGALDTTRIFYKELSSDKKIYLLEEKYINEFKSDYRLNRVAGGINSEDSSALRNLKLISTIQERKLI